MVLSFGRRYGLIGRNGVGKTTLLKHIAAKAFPGIPKNLQILHIEQEIAGTDVSALDTVLKTDFERESLVTEEKMLLQEEASKESGRLGQIYQRLQEIDAFTAPARASAILSGLGFTPEMQKKPTKEFSGGWRMRISLALALFIQPDILLLDEPTNHLDLHVRPSLPFALSWPCPSHFLSCPPPSSSCRLSFGWRITCKSGKRPWWWCLTPAISWTRWPPTLYW